MRIKHAENTRVGLWGQSIILKVAWAVTNGIKSIPLPVRCGSRTNHAEAGGHVTLEAKKARSGCTTCNTRGLRGKRWSPHRNERDPEVVQV